MIIMITKVSNDVASLIVGTFYKLLLYFKTILSVVKIKVFCAFYALWIDDYKYIDLNCWCYNAHVACVYEWWCANIFSFKRISCHQLINYEYFNLFLLIEETTTLVQTKRADCTNKSQEFIVTIARLIIIPTGSIISLVLLLIITREVIRYRRESNQT